MPIQIDQKRAENLAPQFDEALELVRNEFAGLDLHRQYSNAFARLLKPDPLGRVLMMGTDQRDMFVPELRRVIQTSVPSDGHIFDFGAGDGQTFALVADSVPQGTRISLEEPNPEYLANYRAFLETKVHLRPGLALAAEFDAIDAAAERSGEKLPSDGSIDLALALHMIYFVNDLASSVTRMVRFLKPGGVLFVVVTDETVGYTGLALKSLLNAAVRPATTRGISRSLPSAAACWEHPRKVVAPLPTCSAPRKLRWKSTWGASRAASTDTISPT